MNEKNVFICYNLELYNTLINLGFICTGANRNNQHPSYMVWYFVDNEMLREVARQFNELQRVKKQARIYNGLY